MDEDIRAFGEQLGKKAIARDWAGVHAMLAPWLAKAVDADGVRAFFEDEYRSILAGSGIEELHRPEHPEPEVGGNSHVNADRLREPMSFKPGYVRPVAPEVTNENMRYWLNVQLMCSDAQMEALGLDFLADVWMAVVDTPEGLRVGYWAMDPNG